MKKTGAYLFIGFIMVYIPLTVHAQETDTLPVVTLVAVKPLDIAASSVPVQQLNKDNLASLNINSVAEAAKYFPGIVVKDYGGIGGLKTVSIRSLGANHTGVCFDGIMLGDAQGGQIDLGRYSLDNLENVSLYNYQPPDLLLPARTYASAAVIAMSSSSTINNNVRPLSELTIKIKIGSFGFFDPSIHYKTRIKRKLTSGLSAGYQSAKGDYPFTDYETGVSKVRRNNSDIKSWRFEYDATYSMNESNLVRGKVYYFDSKRGLPGSVILYNNFSDERLNNKSFFSQFSWHKRFSSKTSVLLCGKYSADYKYYLDPSYQNAAGKLENEFHQKEFYVSGAFLYKFLRSLAVSYSSDYFKSILKRTDPFASAFANPERNSFLNNISLQWNKKRYELNGNLLHTYMTSKVIQGPVAGDLRELTPAFSGSLQPFINYPLRLRASYKRIFRAPTFDDLYYTNVGNIDLHPEYATLYNFGITLNCKPRKIIKEIIFTADAYCNLVKDKIVAVPRQNLFQWTILNIGMAKTKGIDLAINGAFIKWRGFDISTHISYSYQNALDYSNPQSRLYKTQLPYTPEHSCSVNITISCKKIAFSYNILSSSYRYRLGEPGPENVVQGWATHDAIVAYNIITKRFRKYKFIAEANNIYNSQYEIIKYYPMPGFNYRLGITATL